MAVQLQSPDGVAAAGTAGQGQAGDVVPRPLEEGERVDLWLAVPAAATTARDTSGSASSAAGPIISAVTDGEPAAAHGGAHWDARPARIVATAPARAPDVVALVTGAWSAWDHWMAEGGAAGSVERQVPGSTVLVRRPGPEGIAEWEGRVVAARTLDPRRLRALGGLDALEAPLGTAETLVLVRFTRVAARGRLYQRRRTRRLPVRLTPIRLMPLAAPATAAGASTPDDQDAGLLPVARLTDVSAGGAGVVVDTPLPQGTAVALEFDLPGTPSPFALRGRVVEPAVALHGDVRPQDDGLPGFRRGIEFLGTAADPETQRLDETLAALLKQKK